MMASLTSLAFFSPCSNSWAIQKTHWPKNAFWHAAVLRSLSHKTWFTGRRVQFTRKYKRISLLHLLAVAMIIPEIFFFPIDLAKWCNIKCRGEYLGHVSEFCRELAFCFKVNTLNTQSGWASCLAQGIQILKYTNTIKMNTKSILKSIPWMHNQIG